MRVGDKVKIVNYGYPDDEELIIWAEQQEINVFTISEIDNKNKIFYIKGCAYAIPFDSVDYECE